MAIIDTNAIRSKASALSKRVAKELLYSGLTPLQTESIEREFFKLFDGTTVAQTCDGILSINTKDQQGFNLLTVSQYEMDDHSFNFEMSEFIVPIANKPKFKSVSVIYYDTYDWIFTNKLVGIYRDQINPNTMLLNPDYRNKSIYLRQGNHVRVYTGVAISNPKEQAFSTSAGILQFSFNFIYSNLTDSYL